jgi:hypothetical protein
MLDVHPPHHAASTWRDFFIHIATIVVGLLIALALEQTVEAFHHHRQLVETRKALNKEFAVNRVYIEDATGEFRRYVPILQTNLAILRFLQKHPGAPMSQWPGEYRLITYGAGFNDSIWKTAQQNNTLSLMPDDEATRYADIYLRIGTANELEKARTDALDNVRSVTMEDPDPSHLSPPQLERAIEAMRNCLLAEYRIAKELSNLAIAHPELGLTTPSFEERARILPILETPSSQADKAAVAAVLSREFGISDAFNPPSKDGHK